MTTRRFGTPWPSPLALSPSALTPPAVRTPPPPTAPIGCVRQAFISCRILPFSFRTVALLALARASSSSLRGPAMHRRFMPGSSPAPSVASEPTDACVVALMPGTPTFACFVIDSVLPVGFQISDPVSRDRAMASPRRTRQHSPALSSSSEWNSWWWWW